MFAASVTGERRKHNWSDGPVFGPSDRSEGILEIFGTRGVDNKKRVGIWRVVAGTVQDRTCGYCPWHDVIFNCKSHILSSVFVCISGVADSAQYRNIQYGWGRRISHVIGGTQSGTESTIRFRFRHLLHLHEEFNLIKSKRNQTSNRRKMPKKQKDVDTAEGQKKGKVSSFVCKHALP